MRQLLRIRPFVDDFDDDPPPPDDDDDDYGKFTRSYEIASTMS